MAAVLWQLNRPVSLQGKGRALSVTTAEKLSCLVVPQQKRQILCSPTSTDLGAVAPGENPPPLPRCRDRSRLLRAPSTRGGPRPSLCPEMGAAPLPASETWALKLLQKAH